MLQKIRGISKYFIIFISANILLIMQVSCASPTEVSTLLQLYVLHVLIHGHTTAMNTCPELWNEANTGNVFAFRLKARKLLNAARFQGDFFFDPEFFEPIPGYTYKPGNFFERGSNNVDYQVHYHSNRISYNIRSDTNVSGDGTLVYSKLRPKKAGKTRMYWKRDNPLGAWDKDGNQTLAPFCIFDVDVEIVEREQ